MTQLIRLSSKDKDRLADAIKTVAIDIATTGRLPGAKGGGLCALTSLLTFMTLLCTDEEAIPLAGTMAWPIVKEDDDDGVSPTHFSFLFNTLAAMPHVLSGSLPEIHCWVETSDHEVIDLTTFDLPRMCKEMAGLEWRSDIPPAHLWTKDLPKGVIYSAHPVACNIMMFFFDIFMKQGVVTPGDIARVFDISGVKRCHSYKAGLLRGQGLFGTFKSMVQSRHGKRFESTALPVCQGASLT